jgi:hypothetical protein
VHAKLTRVNRQISRRIGVDLWPHARHYSRHEAWRKAETATHHNGFGIERVHQSSQLSAQRPRGGLDQRLIARRGKHLLA